ncbi:MAG: peroxide stress protein YaaA [Alkalispirochaeta sp.]
MIAVLSPAKTLNFESTAAIDAFTQPHFLGEARQALLAFRGEVYRGLDADSLEVDDIAFAQDHLRILSGLYGVYAKQQRGRMARYIVRKRITDPEDLKTYEDDGYRFRSDLSDDRYWTFRR